MDLALSSSDAAASAAVEVQFKVAVKSEPAEHGSASVVSLSTQLSVKPLAPISNCSREPEVVLARVNPQVTYQTSNSAISSAVQLVAALVFTVPLK